MDGSDKVLGAGQLLRQGFAKEDSPEAMFRLAVRLGVSTPLVVGDVLRHRLVRVEAYLSQAVPSGLVLDEDHQLCADPPTLRCGGHRDVLQQQMIWFRYEHHQTYDHAIVGGQPDIPIPHQRVVIGSHRSRLPTDPGNVPLVCRDHDRPHRFGIHGQSPPHADHDTSLWVRRSEDHEDSAASDSRQKRMSWDADRRHQRDASARRLRRALCEDPPVTVLLEHDHRRFQVTAYHDAIRHDCPALELAELVNDELGPALVTVLFAEDGISGSAEILLANCGLPLTILAAFMEEVVQEERRLHEAGPPWARRNDVR
jgi:hypothetical protein